MTLSPSFRSMAGLNDMVMSVAPNGLPVSRQQSGSGADSKLTGQHASLLKGKTGAAVGFDPNSSFEPLTKEPTG